MARTPEEIRASIDYNRQELGSSLEKLRAEVVVLTDWRSQLRRNEEQLIRVASVSGFVLGGGIAALGGIAFGRGKRRKRRR